MRKYINKFFLFLIVIATSLFYTGLAYSVSLSPSLEKSLAATSKANSDSLVKVILFVENENIGRAAKKSLPPSADFKMNHKIVVESLKFYKSTNLDRVIEEIRLLSPDSEIRRFWITSAIAFDISISKLDRLVDLPGVASIIEDGEVDFIRPEKTFPVAGKVNKTNEVYTQLETLNIPAVWARGIKGTGRLVCSFDTGVEYEHPALQSKWRGNSASNSSAWFGPRSNSETPVDNKGHGTHTMGVMVGNTEVDSFGVAPGAEWITGAVIDQGETLNNTISDIIAAFEWAIDPDGNPNTVDDVPDVILNSWGVPTSMLPPCDETFNQVIDNVEAAGIVTIFAAGNEGRNGSMTIRIPANRATSPLNSFSVGAINQVTNEITEFSSRGPSSCDTTQIKPEVVAPGVGIYSCYKGGEYRLNTGTSMAAPLIAGMVALMRQYNPEATVDEIKMAIIQSTTDLGLTGEDNDYGHGLPDAEKALNLLPLPTNPEIRIVDKIIDDDGIADPGETFNLKLRLMTAAGAFDSLVGILLCDNDTVSIINDQASFLFAPGSSQSMNLESYVINFGDFKHGDTISFDLVLHLSLGVPYDTLGFEITVGNPPNGTMFTHQTAEIQFTVSDFGQFGMAENSVYSAGGDGFKYEDSDNILYEAGIIVGRNNLQLSSSVRDSLGRADRSDFSPITDLATSYLAGEGQFQSYAEFADTKSDIPIPISLSQTVLSYDEPGDDQFVIIRYYLINSTNEPVTDLSFGFLTDFDLDQSGDNVRMFYDNSLYCQFSDQYALGIMPLTDFSGAIAIENGDNKTALTKQDKLNYIRHSGISVDDKLTADFFSILSFGPFNIQPHDSVEISLAIIAGRQVEDVQSVVYRVQQKYSIQTSVDEISLSLPREFELEQNYPNPFNPATVISFQMNTTTSARLSVINTLGQEVAVIFDGPVQPGTYSVEWNGTNNNGRAVASGIYFYQLKSDSSVETKKDDTAQVIKRLNKSSYITFI